MPLKRPYQRVIESGVLKTDEVEALRRRKSELNPFELKEGLELKLKEFFKLYDKKISGRWPNMNKLTLGVLVSFIYEPIRGSHAPA